MVFAKRIGYFTLPGASLPGTSIEDPASLIGVPKGSFLSSVWFVRAGQC